MEGEILFGSLKDCAPARLEMFHKQGIVPVEAPGGFSSQAIRGGNAGRSCRTPDLNKASAIDVIARFARTPALADRLCISGESGLALNILTDPRPDLFQHCQRLLVDLLLYIEILWRVPSFDSLILAITHVLAVAFWSSTNACYKGTCSDFCCSSEESSVNC